MTDWTKTADKAVQFLTETDEKLAELHAKYERDRRKAKSVREAIFLRIEGNIPERYAQAETHADYQSAQAAEMTSLLEYEKLKNKRTIGTKWGERCLDCGWNPEHLEVDLPTQGEKP